MKKRIEEGFPETIYVAEHLDGTYESLEEVSEDYEIDVKIGVYELKNIGIIKKTFKFEEV